MNGTHPSLVQLDTSYPVWEQFYTVAPLVVIGTRDVDGYDLAPKHMAFPLSWENYFGFVCTPSHRTYQNIEREKAFTVSYPRPSQVVLASLAASPRGSEKQEAEENRAEESSDEQNDKPVVDALPTFSSKSIDGVFLQDGYLYLECELDRIVDGFGQNSLIAGKVVGAYVHEDSRIAEDRDGGEMLKSAPLLAYLYPGRFAEINDTQSFPFPADFRK